MAKIFSGLTLVVALVAIFFGLQSKDMVGKLQVAAERTHTDLVNTQEKLKKTEKELATAKEELTAAKDEAAKAKDALAKAEADTKKAKDDLVAAAQKADDAEKKFTEIKTTYDAITAALGGKEPATLLKSLDEKDAANKDLTAKVATLDSDNAAMKLTVDTLTAKQKDFDEKLASKSKKLERYEKNIMQKGIRGEVLAVNAGWGFCVLSIGDRRGAAANKIMIVARNGQAIGKVKIINVEASQSVADIIPSSFVRGTYVQPGDEVIYTGDDKVREEPAAAAANAPAPSTSSPSAPELPHL